MNANFSSFILETTGASAFEVEEIVQELWSGYGQILRLSLTDAESDTIVAKFIDLPNSATHPRGWSTPLSHQRKVKSYQVEAQFYKHYSQCETNGRIPRFLGFLEEGTQILLLLEDLDGAGYPRRLATVGSVQIEFCLQWLAEFHATYLCAEWTPFEGLWETGTYWHLETRPDELAALEDEPLKAAASEIDAVLRKARYQTLVHGDAKLANFCFSRSADRVAALDFQYVGMGCGMKDVAYFLGSCLDEDTVEAQEEGLLDTYFSFLTNFLRRRSSSLDSVAVITEWRSLYPYAWADFHRFLKGWCPTHWKLNSYSEQMVKRVFDRL